MSLFIFRQGIFLLAEMAFINIELDYAEILPGFTKFIINYGVRIFAIVYTAFSTMFLFSHKKSGLLFCDYFPKVNKHMRLNVQTL